MRVSGENTMNILSRFGLPPEFGVILLVISSVLLLSPYFPGIDIGPLKIPVFSERARRGLRIVGPLALLIAAGLHFPLFPDRPRDLPSAGSGAGTASVAEGEAPTARQPPTSGLGAESARPREAASPAVIPADQPADGQVKQRADRAQISAELRNAAGAGGGRPETPPSVAPPSPGPVDVQPSQPKAADRLIGERPGREAAREPIPSPSLSREAIAYLVQVRLSYDRLENELKTHLKPLETICAAKSAEQMGQTFVNERRKGAFATTQWDRHVQLDTTPTGQRDSHQFVNLYYRRLRCLLGVDTDSNARQCQGSGSSYVERRVTEACLGNAVLNEWRDAALELQSLKAKAHPND